MYGLLGILYNIVILIDDSKNTRVNLIASHSFCYSLALKLQQSFLANDKSGTSFQWLQVKAGSCPGLGSLHVRSSGIFMKRVSECAAAQICLKMCALVLSY
jgi:hypothetical protein